MGDKKSADEGLENLRQSARDAGIPGADTLTEGELLVQLHDHAVAAAEAELGRRIEEKPELAAITSRLAAEAMYWAVEDLEQGQRDGLYDRASMMRVLVATYRTEGAKEALAVHREFKLAGRAPLAARPLTPSEVLAFAYQRAEGMGFDPAELLPKQQGRRSDRSAKVRAARVAIAAALHQDGASQRQIGRVMGGISPQAVQHWLRQARKGAEQDG